MHIKITGYYKLPNETEPKLIDFDDIFDVGFMRKYTKYRSFDKFLSGGRFGITCQKDFEDLPEEKMDSFVQKSTKFKSWQEMLDFATDKYILRRS